MMRVGAKTDASLGLVPLGTANDFARSFGDDATDIGRSIRRAVTGAPEAIDVGVVNGEIFVNAASGGFGAMITATTPLELKKSPWRPGLFTDRPRADLGVQSECSPSEP